MGPSTWSGTREAEECNHGLARELLQESSFVLRIIGFSDICLSEHVFWIVHIKVGQENCKKVIVDYLN